MPFCSSCGNKTAEHANFCAQCGHKVTPDSVSEHQANPEQQIHEPLKKKPVHNGDNTYSILEQGTIFKEHYRIEKNIGKDNDGISYMVTDIRNNARRSLKIFHPSYFASVDKMLGAIVSIAKIKTLTHPNIARVFEVHQTGKPAFVVSEYIDGISLAHIKEYNAEQLSETKSREIARQLADAAITIRKAGLAIRNLNINNIVIAEGNKAVILSSGINYDVSEEREDLFTFGIVLAKLFSTSAFYETMYDRQKVSERRFEQISGITVGMNEIIAACLQKNMLLKYSKFEEVAKALAEIKPVRQEDVYEAYDTVGSSYRDEHILKLPERRLDIWFWLMVIFIGAFVFIMLTTNLLDKIFGKEKTSFKFTGLVTENIDSTASMPSETNDNYRKIKRELPAVEPRLIRENVSSDQQKQTVNPNIVIPPPIPTQKENFDKQNTQPGQSQGQTQTNVAPPKDLVRIGSDVFAYGTLKAGVKVNVSLSVFYISASEVTQGEWKKYMRQAEFTNTGDNLPVDNVSWFEIITYCNARSEAEGLVPCYKVFGTGVSRSVTCNFKANGYRLPTEAEWEYAAKAKELHPYSGSAIPEPVAWLRGNSGRRLHQVKAKAANAFGLYDMTGNVSEWCWDWYDANYPKNMPYLNPTGPDIGAVRTVRGGNVDTGAGNALEVIYRGKGTPSNGYPFVGFRVVRTK